VVLKMLGRERDDQVAMNDMALHAHTAQLLELNQRFRKAGE
jgi:hypothetical protein